MQTYKLDNEKELIAVLENLLTKGVVDGIMVQTKGENGTFPSLVTNPEFLKDSAPFSPMFSGNIATGN